MAGTNPETAKSLQKRFKKKTFQKPTHYNSMQQINCGHQHIISPPISIL